MSHIINISVKNHVAKQTDQTIYVCGNDDFVINFAFDSEWDQYDVKTARFTYGGTYVDVVFSGNECAVPVITDVWRFKVGVFAGDLSTTTPVLISASKSILCDAGAPVEPTDDVYNQIMEVVNEATTASNEAKAAAEAVTPDDTAIDGQPWTSKHIVDELCPEISETGNPVQCYPLKGYPLTATASWEPTQEGSGDPSPDNVRPIKGRDSVTIQRCGGNLANVADREGVVDGYYVEIPLSVKALPNTDYTLSFYCQTSVENWRVSVGIGKTYLSKDIKYTSYNQSTDNTRIELTFSVTDEQIAANGDTLFFRAPRYDAIASFTYNISQISVIYGTTAPTEYVPYTGITQTLTLPETIYGGSVANDGSGTQNIKICTIDGTKVTFRLDASGRYWNLPKLSATGIGKSGKLIYCSAFANTIFGLNRDSEFFYTTPAKIANYFGTLDELNAFCVEQNAAGTPVQIAYSLEIPTTFTATGGGELTGLDGVNNVLTDADSVTVEGREDIKHTIKELQDALASVQEA